MRFPAAGFMSANFTGAMAIAVVTAVMGAVPMRLGVGVAVADVTARGVEMVGSARSGDETTTETSVSSAVSFMFVGPPNANRPWLIMPELDLFARKRRYCPQQNGVVAQLRATIGSAPD